MGEEITDWRTAQWRACPTEVRPFLQALFDAYAFTHTAIAHRNGLRHQLELLRRQRDHHECPSSADSDAEIERLGIELEAADTRVEEQSADIKRVHQALIDRMREHRLRHVPLGRREDALRLLAEEQRQMETVNEAFTPFLDRARGDWERQVILAKERSHIQGEIISEYDRRLTELADGAP